MRAAFSLPWDRWTEETTEQPMPNSIPNPVIIIQKGANILTAASASLPTPWPTNTPSMVVITAIQAIPINVGMNIFLKSPGMLSEPKSMASLFIFKFITFPNRAAKIGQIYSDKEFL